MVDIDKAMGYRIKKSQKCAENMHYYKLNPIILAGSLLAT